MNCNQAERIKVRTLDSCRELSKKKARSLFILIFWSNRSAKNTIRISERIRRDDSLRSRRGNQTGMRNVPAGSQTFRPSSAFWTTRTFISKRRKRMRSTQLRKSKFRSPVFRANSFRKFRFQKAPMKISAEVFNHFILTHDFAITNEHNRVLRSPRKIMIENGTARMVTTDGLALPLSKRNWATLRAKKSIRWFRRKLWWNRRKSRAIPRARSASANTKINIYLKSTDALLIIANFRVTFPNYEMVISER